MDLNETLFFVQVVRAGSFTEAAQQLGMTKSKVSRKVQELEDRLGVTLLQRTTRSLSLTGAGEEYFNRSARALDEIKDAEALATQSQETLRGLLKITTTVDAGVSFLGTMLKDFASLHPEIQVELHCTDTVIDLVRDGFDLALRMGELDDSTLVGRKIGNLKMALYASPKYLKARGTPKTPQDLLKHSCLGFLSESGGYPLILPGGKESRKFNSFAQFTSDNLLLLHHLALAGEGIAYLPTFLCKDVLNDGHLLPVLQDWQPRTGAGAYLVFPKKDFLPKRVRALLEYLTPRLKDYFT